jgi:hypothetical protein
VEGSCEDGNKNTGSIKWWGNSSVAERVSMSQGWLSFMDLEGWYFVETFLTGTSYALHFYAVFPGVLRVSSPPNLAHNLQCVLRMKMRWDA